MLKKFALVCMIGASFTLIAQKSEYLNNFTQGNLLFLERNYSMALDNYKLAYLVDSSNANINFKIGQCYLNLHSRKKMALPYMEKAVTNISKAYDEDDARMKSAPPYAIYYLAASLHYAGRFQEAIDQFQKYLKIIKSSRKDEVEEIQRQIEMCNNGITLSAKPENVVITNLGDSVNTQYPEDGPVVTADESMMLFTSRRSGERDIDGRFFEDIFITKTDSLNKWGGAAKLFSAINSEADEATLGLSPDGQTAYIFVSKEATGGDLYFSKLGPDHNWTKPESFGEEVNSKHHESHITVSPDGNTVFFSSDRPGGIGGTDLYIITKKSDGKWSLPTNLGPSVNTKYNEDAPYFHPDGKMLFFSSEGHTSIGGLDLFYTMVTRDAQGGVSCSTPVSLGVPLNTTDDDEFYVPTANGRFAYFSSAREGGKGDFDLYKIEMKTPLPVDPLVILKGNVTFEDGKPAPDKAEINVFDAATGDKIGSTQANPLTGKYVMILKPESTGKKYKVNYDATGFQSIAYNFEVEANYSYKEVINDADFEFMDKSGKSGTVSLNGTVKNDKGAFIPGVLINIKDNKTGELIKSYTTSSDSGSFYFAVSKGRNYNISFEASGYLFQSQNIDVPKKKDFTNIRKDIILDPVKTGAKMVMNNIFFDFNKANLRQESLVELENVVKLLTDNAGVSIEISGFTDSRGNAALNNRLSQLRADAVVAYLAGKGVDAKRLVAKGYGKLHPIAPNNLPNGRPDADGMQKNRRVEMKILEKKD